MIFSTKELGPALIPGLYSDAMRAGFAEPGHPGLEVSFAGQGFNELTGSFNISELTFRETKFLGHYEFKTLEATFEQKVYFSTWYGLIRYVLSPVPEPSVPFLACGAILIAALRRKR